MLAAPVRIFQLDRAAVAGDRVRQVRCVSELARRVRDFVFLFHDKIEVQADRRSAAHHHRNFILHVLSGTALPHRPGRRWNLRGDFDRGNRTLFAEKAMPEEIRQNTPFRRRNRKSYLLQKRVLLSLLDEPPLSALRRILHLYTRRQKFLPQFIRLCPIFRGSRLFSFL